MRAEQFVTGKASSSYDDVAASLIPPRSRWPRQPDRLDRWRTRPPPIAPDGQTVQLRCCEVADHRAGVGGLGTRGAGDRFVPFAVHVVVVKTMETLVAHQPSQVVVLQPELTQRGPRLRHRTDLGQSQPNLVSQPFHTQKLPRRGHSAPASFSTCGEPPDRDPDFEHGSATPRVVRRPSRAQSGQGLRSSWTTLGTVRSCNRRFGSWPAHKVGNVRRERVGRCTKSGM